MQFRRNDQLVQILKKVAPGTPLRASLDQIIESKNGALIVLSDKPEIMAIAHGGFELNTEFAPIKLYELAKMDGAIVVSSDFSYILRANVHLVPDLSLKSNETGMRQRTSERVAKQMNVPVISISEELGSILLYMGDVKYILEDIRLLLARASQALQALEKYKIRLEQVLANLNDLELEDLVTIEDVATAVQRFEMVERVSGEIERYVVELGEEGRLIEMQLDELIGNVHDEYSKLIQDYGVSTKSCTFVDITERLSTLSSEELLELHVIAKILGYGLDLMQTVTPKGYRLLGRIPRLPAPVIEKLIDHFGDLSHIVKASAAELDRVEGVGDARARLLWEGLRRLSEMTLAERYI